MSELVITVQQLADKEGVDYLTASGLLRYLREKGIAQEAGKSQKKGKGRSAVAYRLPERVELTFTLPAVTEPEPATQVATPEPAPEPTVEPTPAPEKPAAVESPDLMSDNLMSEAAA